MRSILIYPEKLKHAYFWILAAYMRWHTFRGNDTRGDSSVRSRHKDRLRESGYKGETDPWDLGW